MSLNSQSARIERRGRIQRMLSPRSIAFIGGRIAEMALARCREAGYAGEIYAVSPSRRMLGDIPCYPDVKSLPVVPDAAYIGVNRYATIEVARELAERGAGGCVSYAAGFAEVGGEGIEIQRRLVEAAGDMPLVGPNCFGFINYLDRLALWPYLFGGAPVSQGVALISQSGNVAMNLTMNLRSVRLTHVICGGNQAVLGAGDYVDALLEDPRVRAIGLVIEGLDDLYGFAAAAQRALDKRVPIVALKIGCTRAGAERASSHTSSLAGSDALYDAYFRRLGVIRVDSLHRLLETLKVFDICGPLAGHDVVTLSCSGGEATMLADLTVQNQLETSPFALEQQRDLEALFPNYVTVSNPFDYNTSIWGDRKAMERCFTLSLSGAHQAAILVYDHPTVEGTEVAEWLDALDAFIAAQRNTDMRAFVVCSVSELLPSELRERLIAAGITPLQGLEDAAYAIGMAAHYLPRRESALRRPLPRAAASATVPEGALLDEWSSKRRLAAVGVPVPEARCVSARDLRQAAQELGFPLALKACGAAFAHKSELGAVRIGIETLAELERAHTAIETAAASRGLVVGQYLLERMVEDGVAEIIVGIHVDPQFGPTLLLGSGGILVELVADRVSLLLPTDRESIAQALMSLKVGTLLKGFRGRQAGDLDAAVEAVMCIASFAEAHWERVAELDVNPLIVRPKGRGAVAVDALIRLSDIT